MAKGRGTQQHTEHLAKAATFVAVVRAGSLAAAAKQLAVGKSTLSEQLTALEDALGARLLERTSRGIALTQEGQVFFEGALKSLEAWEEAWSLAGQHRESAAGTLRVAAPVGFEQFLAEIIKGLSAEHPELRYDLSFDDRPLDLVGDGFDVGLRMGAHAASSLSARKLGASPEVFVSSQRLPETLAALQSADWVCHAAFQQAYRNVRREDGEHVSLPAPSVRGVANSTEGALRLVEIGLGIALIPELLVRERIAAGRLRRVFPGFVGRSIPLVAVFPSRRHRSRRVEVFSRAVVDALKS
ncbi:MAG: LysR family transcriptional regulator [Polyangiaceae bacterium]